MRINIRNRRWPSSSGPFLALIAIYLGFALFGPESFSSLRTLETITRQSAIVASVALGMTWVIILGGVDLSVGSIVAFTTVVIAQLLNQDYHPLSAAAIGIGAAAMIGAFNGILIARLKLAPFIVTLGTLLIIRGAAKGAAGEQKIDAPLSLINQLLISPSGPNAWMILAPGVWAVIGCAAIVILALKFTRFGRHATAIGSNEKSARLCGVAIEETKIMVYFLSGLFAGLGGLLQFSRLTVGDPTVASGLELDTIAAVVIGGGSLSGGEGSIFGSIVGAVTMTVIRAGGSQMGLQSWLQEIITGAIIVGAVTLDRYRSSRRR